MAIQDTAWDSLGFPPSNSSPLHISILVWDMKQHVSSASPTKPFSKELLWGGNGRRRGSAGRKQHGKSCFNKSKLPSTHTARALVAPPLVKEATHSSPTVVDVDLGNRWCISEVFKLVA